MKITLTISFVLLFHITFGQRPTIINGIIVDEKGKPVANAALHYGKNDATQDTSYTDAQGRFKVAYPNPQEYSYYFYIERSGFFPKAIFISLSRKEIFLKKPILFRSRNGFWFDIKEIDSTQIGITVKEAILKFKLDSSQCTLSDEPPGVYRSFHTEVADSSIVNFSIKGFFSSKRIKMTDICNLRITGFGITDTKGNEKIIGNGRAVSNPYYEEQQIQHK